MLKLVLVSNSPRRVQILKKHNYEFSTISVQTSEILDKNLSLDEALIQISKEKVSAGLSTLVQSTREKSLVLIGADTAVCLGRDVLGKPQDESQAREHLGRLSGRGHEVKTAVSLFNTETSKWVNFVETTRVYMKPFTAKDIDDYIKTGEPFDKAGAYGIQGEGRRLVERYNGSWYSVVGFPIEMFKLKIGQQGWVLR